MSSFGTNDHNFIAEAEVASYRMAVIGFCAFMLLFGFAGGNISPVFCGLLVITSLIISGYLTIRNGKKVRPGRFLKQNCAFEKSLLPIRVTIDNSSEKIFLFSQFEDYFPPGGSIYHQVNVVDMPFFAGKHYDIKTAYYCGNRRGKYRVGPFRTRIFGPFFFTMTVRSDVSKNDFFIYPRPDSLENTRFAIGPAPFSIGLLNSRKAGQGQDFIGIREYGRYDDPRHIHWPSTAKSGALMLKEFEEIGATRFTIFFDLDREVLAGLGHHTTAEYAVKAVSTIAKFAIDAGHQVQVVAEGDKMLFHPFGSGYWHLIPLLQKLCEIKPQGKISLVRLIEKHLQLVPGNSSVIIILSQNTREMNKFAGIIRCLHAKSVKINIIMIDHTTFLPIYRPHDLDQSSVFSSEIKKLGINVYFVAKGDNLVKILEGGAWNDGK